jgi:hypothetical protein
MVKRWIVLLFLGIFLISLVSAVGDITNINSQQGYEIYYPQFDVVKQNQGFELHIQVSNLSNGLHINNTLATCSLNLYNSSGMFTADEIILIKDDDYYGYYKYIAPGNFSDIGLHSFYIVCYSTNFGGEAFGIFDVTYSGMDLTTGSSIFYAILIFLMILLLVGTLYGTGKLPGMNEKDEDGRIMSVKWGKYLRAPLYFVAWMLFIAILYISSNLAFAYLGEQLFAKVLFALFRICFGVTPLIVVVWFVWFFVRFFQDKKFQTLLNRGIFPQGKGKKW